MKPILNVLSGQIEKRPPLWMMRQAGRYLPEYRDLRMQAGSFLDLVYRSEWAAEVTVQPIRRFGFDAAILFSDILIVPHGMGCDLKFMSGEGPRLEAVTCDNDLKKLQTEDNSKFQSVYETVDRVKTKLKTELFDQTSLIGFAGGPWTVACYMVQGSAHDHDFDQVRALAFSNPDFFDALIDQITASTIVYLKGQIQAGADLIQIFDSWAGVAGGSLFDRYVVAPTQKIVTALHKIYPNVPVIGFPRGGGNRLASYAQKTGIQGLGCDYATCLSTVRQTVSPHLALQGNLDPLALLAGGDFLQKEIENILQETKNTPHIFNLGHGILPSTPLAHVEQLVKIVRGI